MKNYIIKLNGKTISKRKVAQKTCILGIYHSVKTGVFKSIDCFKDKITPIYYTKKHDNPNAIYYDWATFNKVGNDFVAEFNYSKNQQKIDILKQARSI
jgi:hypothetical protein